MNLILVGNVVSFFGCIAMVIVGLLKDRNKVLITQSIQVALMGTANFILGGMSGVITAVITIIRNVFCYKQKYSGNIKLIFTVVLFALGVSYNHDGLIGWLPIISTVLMTVFIDTKSDITMKIIIASGCVMWAIYDFHFNNYVSLTFDALTVIASVKTILELKSIETGTV